MKTPPWVDPSWSQRVPDLLSAAQRRWQLTIHERVTSHVAAVFTCADPSGRALVLKLAPPEAHADREAAALRVWHGRGAPRLLEHARDLGALLLERVVPGTHLPAGHDDDATALVAAVARRLHVIAPEAEAFPSQADAYAEWRDRVRVNAEPNSAGVRLLDLARDAFVELDTSTAQAVVLHGDLIDKNLLRSADGYVAVDPIPRIGDACSDIGFYAAYHPPASGIVARARVLATALGLDPERAARWATVWAVGEATETWRADSDELQAWVTSDDALRLLSRT